MGGSVVPWETRVRTHASAMTKATRTILVLAIAAPLVCGGLYIGGRALVGSLAAQQQQAAERRAEQAAQDAIEREAALKERRRAAALRIPLATLGESSPKSAPAQGTASVPRSAPGRIEIVQLGGEHRLSALPPPVQSSVPPQRATPPKFTVAPINIAPKPSRIEFASAEPSPQAVGPSGVAPVAIAPKTSKINGATMEVAPKPPAPAAVAPLKADVATGPSPALLQLRDDPQVKLQPTATASLTPIDDLMQSQATISSSPASNTIRLGTVDGLKKELPPPLEEQRRAEEARTVADIKIASGFECSAPLSVIRKSATHYAVKFDGKRGSLDNYFLFQVTGAKGKTIRIDFEDAPIGKWWSLNPVYSYVADLSSPANFTSEPVAEPAKPVAGHNGPLLPDTRAEKWHFMPNVWTEQSGWTGEPGRMKTSSGRLSMVHTFDEDSAYVALKVPYTPSMNERFIASLKGNPHAQVIEIGRTPQGRPMNMIKFGGDSDADKIRPCVFIYSREHGTEQDSSWVVHGAIEYLLSNAPSAKHARENYTILLLPVMDPDGAAASFYDRITYSFTHDYPSPEAIALSQWFEEWVNENKRLDITINVHNMESAEMEHLLCMYSDPERVVSSTALHGSVIAQTKLGEFYKASRRLGTGYTTNRIGGWIGYYFGPLPMLYEVNSQESSRHLNLTETRALGPLFVNACREFLDGQSGQNLCKEIDSFRSRRVEIKARTRENYPTALERAYLLRWTTANHQREMSPSSKR